jgi:hypothetical protein
MCKLKIPQESSITQTVYCSRFSSQGYGNMTHRLIINFYCNFKILLLIWFTSDNIYTNVQQLRDNTDITRTKCTSCQVSYLWLMPQPDAMILRLHIPNSYSMREDRSRGAWLGSTLAVTPSPTKVNSLKKEDMPKIISKTCLGMTMYNYLIYLTYDWT